MNYTSSVKLDSISTRFEVDGTAISNKIQNDECGGCGMGLCSPREWHPWLACETFERTHDSREVWRALRRAVRAADPDVAGAERLHEVFYGD